MFSIIMLIYIICIENIRLCISEMDENNDMRTEESEILCDYKVLTLAPGASQLAREVMNPPAVQET